MPEDDSVVRYVIYPCVGIASVGNAPEEFFIGPEAPGEAPHAEGGFKDAEGRVKRQAARFRVYGKRGQVQIDVPRDRASEFEPQLVKRSLRGGIPWLFRLPNDEEISVDFQKNLSSIQARQITSH